jgi:putative membrane protein
MHLGKKYTLKEYFLWTKREIFYLFLWSLISTAIIEIFDLVFLWLPSPILTVVGSAVAIVLAFKNQQCYARITEALSLSSQLNSLSAILANKLSTTIGSLPDTVSGPLLKSMFYRHFAWLTALRFSLREPKAWENVFEPGNAKYLAELPTPESQSSLKIELGNYLSENEVQEVMSHKGDKESLILRWQYKSIEEVRAKGLLTDYMVVILMSAVDEISRLQGALKRIKNYPYARNYYSISLILVRAFVGIVPFGLFSYAREVGESAGIEHLTVWLNVPFSVFVGWIFVTLEKVGENSSNPFEGGPNDVPISSFARRIEIEMRTLLGEQTELKPLEAKYGILF